MFKRIRENFSKDDLRVIIKHAFYIILISALAGFVFNLYHPDGFVFVSKKSEKLKNIVFISSEEAKIKKENPSAVFVDSRPYDEFEITHIPGAVNIPAVPDPEAKIKDHAEVLNNKTELVIYCDGMECGSSQILADKLIVAGYSRHIYIIKNGIPEWKDKGFPVETEEKEKKNSN